MTEEEQEAITSRILSEYLKAKELRVLLRYERRRLGLLIEAVAIAMQGESGGADELTDAHFAALDVSKIQQLFDETKKNDEDLRRSKEYLSGLGYGSTLDLGDDEAKTPEEIRDMFKKGRK